MSANVHEILIRSAYPDDRAALVRLAALDSAEAVPPEPLLVAELDGALSVALSMRDGSVIADPFAPTAEVIELLRLRAKAHAAYERGQRLPFAAVRRLALGFGQPS
jgi:hypothetical protein